MPLCRSESRTAGSHKPYEIIDTPRGVVHLLCRLPARILWSESEQDISRHSAKAGIAGVDEYHAVDDYRSRPIDGATPGLDAVHRLEFASRIEVPDHAAILGGISAQVSVHRS